MSPPIVGLIGFCLLMVLFAMEVPIAFSMLIAGIIGFCYMTSPEAGLSLLGSDIYSQLSNYSFTAIPMFVLGGTIALASGVGARLFNAAYVVFRWFPGGLAIASTVACACFGAICGSSTATTATIGKIALPVMKSYHYDDALSTGSIAVAGTLGVLIPPSTIFIIYGILTEQSIGKLFIAGVLPGIMLTGLLAATIAILCLRNPTLAPPGPPATTQQKREGIIGISETLVIFLFIIGGLFLGWFSPTQAGAILAIAHVSSCSGQKTDELAKMDYLPYRVGTDYLYRLIHCCWSYYFWSLHSGNNDTHYYRSMALVAPI